MINGFPFEFDSLQGFLPLVFSGSSFFPLPLSPQLIKDLNINLRTDFSETAFVTRAASEHSVCRTM